MGMGPVPASKRCLSRAGWEPKDLDLMEINEAFAAQAIAVNRQMGWDTKKVNVNGGAIALGHPIGASGARILVTLLHEMQKRDAKQRPRLAVHRRRHGRRARSGTLERKAMRSIEAEDVDARRTGRRDRASRSCRASCSCPAAWAASAARSAAASGGAGHTVVAGCLPGYEKKDEWLDAHARARACGCTPPKATSPTSTPAPRCSTTCARWSARSTSWSTTPASRATRCSSA